MLYQRLSTSTVGQKGLEKPERKVEILVWGRGAATDPGDHSTVYL